MDSPQGLTEADALALAEEGFFDSSPPSSSSAASLSLVTKVPAEDVDVVGTIEASETVNTADQRSTAGDETDYGSDFDTDGEQIISQLVTGGALSVPVPLSATSLSAAVDVVDAGIPLLLESIEQDELPSVAGNSTAAGRDGIVATAHVPKSMEERASQSSIDQELERYFEERKRRREFSVEVEYAESNRRAWSVPVENEDGKGDDNATPEREPSRTPVPDTRSPLDRFRKPPKKPLSVTDLVSPSWCELQYWYTLTKYGRTRQTPAMKQGTKVHKVLEEQVHTTVPVKAVKTKEEVWGLKIWNAILGLRTLRDIGMTRELEVWGVVEGEVVNGIIDQLSYTCPNKDLEEEAELNAQKESEKGKSVDGTQQRTLSEYFSSRGGTTLEDTSAWVGSLTPDKKVYITDVKTRGAKTLPTGASLRPTTIQLMLYHRMIATLAANSVDSDAIFKRYKLNKIATFSDAFIAEVGGIGSGFDSMPSSNEGEDMPPSQHDSLADLLSHNSLQQLWQLMMEEYRKTIPHGADSMGQVLQAEFRSSRDGLVIGTKEFLYDEDQLNKYLTDGMKWWRGEREARGVEIEEAFKCRFCDFRDECTWRRTKIEEAVEKQRLKQRKMKRSDV